MSPLFSRPRQHLAPLTAALSATAVLALAGAAGLRIAMAGDNDDQADTPTSIVVSDQAFSAPDGSVPCSTSPSNTSSPSDENGGAASAGGQTTSGNAASAAGGAGAGSVASIATQVAAVQAMGQQATFRLCGASDPTSERAIEQLIAGRSFSTTLTARPDGCADLAVQVSPQAGGTFSSGSQTTNVSVSAGGRTIAVKITTQNGVTRASIGA